jgi:hypothetical protein
MELNKEITDLEFSNQTTKSLKNTTQWWEELSLLVTTNSLIWLKKNLKHYTLVHLLLLNQQDQLSLLKKPMLPIKIGLKMELFLMLKIKDNVDHAGHSQLLEHLKDFTPLKLDH